MIIRDHAWTSSLFPVVAVVVKVVCQCLLNLCFGFINLDTEIDFTFASILLSLLILILYHGTVELVIEHFWQATAEHNRHCNAAHECCQPFHRQQKTPPIRQGTLSSNTETKQTASPRLALYKLVAKS